jgi:L-ribulokinase
MAKTARKFAIGVDYGTNSVRALVVDTSEGSELASHVYDYPSGEHGVLLDKNDPHVARQNPADYIDGFFTAVRRAVSAAKKKRGFKPENVVGIGVDTTGSTPIPVDRDGTPLALQPKFK